MDTEDLVFLAKVLTARGGDDPRVRPIPGQRLAALARNLSGITEQEMATLMLSPTTRRRLEDLRQGPPVAANYAGFIPRELDYAADDGRGNERTFTVKLQIGRLTVRPGPRHGPRYLLELQLDPATPGGVAGRHVSVWEQHSNEVWLSGTTDEAGELLATWSLPGATPHERRMLDRLISDLAEPGP